MHIRHSPELRTFQTGFTFLGVMFLLFLISLLSAKAMEVTSLTMQRQAEEELLVIGQAYQQALRSYANRTPPGLRPAPMTLDDLVNDTRGPIAVHHLRKVYYDPLTGTKEWGTLIAPGGGIVGVYSLSTKTPIKVANFPLGLEYLNDKKAYKEWIFSGVQQVPTAIPLPQSTR